MTTFCSHCGAQMQGDERFCVACGTPASAAAAGTVAAAVPAPVAAPNGGMVASVPAPPPLPVPMAPMAVAYPYALSGGIPVAGAPAVPAKHGARVGIWVAIAAVLAGAYYYSTHRPAATTPAAPSSQPAAPAQPGTPAQPGAPTQPGGSAPQGAPAQPAPDTGALLQQQSFAGHWRAIYGFVDVSNGVWTNHANVAMQSATLECAQYSANGTELSQMRMTLNGPVQAGAYVSFNPFQMGSVSTYMTRVTCAIVAVTSVN